MKFLAILFCAVFSLAVFAEVEIELSTGSRFKAKIKKLTSKYVIVNTKIGELKLTREMLSPACRASLKAYSKSKSKGEKIDAKVKVLYKEKTLSREKETFKRGRKKVIVEKAGVLTITFSALPGGKSFSGRIEYEFTAQNRGRKRGKVYILDRGIKTFTIEPNERNPEIIIQSKSVTHAEASHTGDTIRELGSELKGYRVKVYLEGKMIYEGEK